MFLLLLLQESTEIGELHVLAIQLSAGSSQGSAAKIVQSVARPEEIDLQCGRNFKKSPLVLRVLG